MNPNDQGQIDMVEKLLYTAFEKRLNEVVENVPHAIEIIKRHDKEIQTELEKRIDAIDDMDEETVDTLLNMTVTYFMKALLFHVAGDSFFDGE